MGEKLELVPKKLLTKNDKWHIIELSNKRREIFMGIAALILGILAFFVNPCYICSTFGNCTWYSIFYEDDNGSAAQSEFALCDYYDHLSRSQSGDG